jgi:hypothetical protein
MSTFFNTGIHFETDFVSVHSTWNPAVETNKPSFQIYDASDNGCMDDQMFHHPGQSSAASGSCLADVEAGSFGQQLSTAAQSGFLHSFVNWNQMSNLPGHVINITDDISNESQVIVVQGDQMSL